ncbi:N utilization substance protein B [Thiorhodovibrio litoralis]|nr:N utilization substance protein B [Thiorhodovibrio litoralis]
MDAVARGLAGCGEDQPIPTDQRFDLSLFDQLLRGVTLQVDEIDATLKPFLDRSLTSVDPVERAILRLGTFELLHSPHIPSAVILDEAVDLAKAFGAEQGHRFINGVLDKLAQQRPDLVSRHGSLEHDG